MDSLAALFLSASDAINAPAAARAAARPVVLPVEDAAAVAAVAQLRAGAAASGRPVSLAEVVAASAAGYRATGDRAHKRAVRRAAQMRQAIADELAHG